MTNLPLNDPYAGMKKAIAERYGHWTSAMRAAMLEDIKLSEKCIELHAFRDMKPAEPCHDSAA